MNPSDITHDFNVYNGSSPYCFISYSSKDKASVYPIVNSIGQEKVRFWIDTALQPAEQWQETLIEKIEKAAHCIVFVSTNSMDSRHVKNELIYATNCNIDFSPVLLQNLEVSKLFRFSLQSYQYLPAYQLNPQEIKYNIIRTLPPKVFFPKIQSVSSTIMDKTLNLLREWNEIVDIKPLAESLHLEPNQIKSYVSTNSEKLNCYINGDLLCFSNNLNQQTSRIEAEQTNIPPPDLKKISNLSKIVLQTKEMEFLTHLSGMIPLRVKPLNIFDEKNYHQINYGVGVRIKNNIITGLNLSSCGLRFLPPSIGNLTHLEFLKIRDNSIIELPEELTKCTELTFLDASLNKLTTLPVSIEKLIKLETLYLNQNRLNYVPHTIKNLIALKYLDLNENQLTYLPNTIGFLKSLQKLRIHHNLLLELPPYIQMIKKMNLLSMNGNPFLKLTDEIENWLNQLILYNCEIIR